MFYARTSRLRLLPARMRYGGKDFSAQLGRPKVGPKKENKLALKFQTETFSRRLTPESAFGTASWKSSNTVAKSCLHHLELPLLPRRGHPSQPVPKPARKGKQRQMIISTSPTRSFWHLLPSSASPTYTNWICQIVV